MGMFCDIITCGYTRLASSWLCNLDSGSIWHMLYTENGQCYASAKSNARNPSPFVFLHPQSNAVGWLSQSVTDTVKGWQEQVVELLDSFERWVPVRKGTRRYGSS